SIFHSIPTGPRSRVCPASNPNARRSPACSHAIYGTNPRKKKWTGVVLDSETNKRVKSFVDNCNTEVVIDAARIFNSVGNIHCFLIQTAVFFLYAAGRDWS